MKRLLLIAFVVGLLVVTFDWWAEKLMDALWNLVDQNVYNYNR